MDNKQKGLNISAKSFLAAIAIIFLLMLSTYILTFVIPGGAYKRIPDENGNMIKETLYHGYMNTPASWTEYEYILIS